jgi:hypothetical protein
MENRPSNRGDRKKFPGQKDAGAGGAAGKNCRIGQKVEGKIVQNLAEKGLQAGEISCRIELYFFSTALETTWP